MISFKEFEIGSLFVDVYSGFRMFLFSVEIEVEAGTLFDRFYLPLIKNLLINNFFSLSHVFIFFLLN